MASLKITKTDGSVSEHRVTPTIQYAFEQHKGMGFHKALEEGRQGDIFWMAWECLRRAGATPPAFGEKFVETLEDVEILQDSPLE